MSRIWCPECGRPMNDEWADDNDFISCFDCNEMFELDDCLTVRPVTYKNDPR